jgi:phosphoserine phosphatase
MDACESFNWDGACAVGEGENELPLTAAVAAGAGKGVVVCGDDELAGAATGLKKRPRGFGGAILNVG